MYKRMHNVALHDRPREKLIKKGARALSDFELLQVIVGNGVRTAHVGQIATSIKKVVSKVGLQGLCVETLRAIPGMSTAKTSNILAAIEYIRRHNMHRGTRIKHTEDILPFVAHIRDKKQEYVLTITLDGANCVVEVRTIAIGTLTTALIHPREVFADAIAERAAGIILVHNHPSGILEPSAEDKKRTAQLRQSGRILGIPLKDHVIVTREGYCSMSARDLL